MRTDQIIQAFSLPTASMVGQRVPRKMLLEQGALTESDKRHFQDGVKDLIWVAEVKPVHVNIPAFKDTAREYAAIAAVSVTFQDEAKVAHLTDLIHRAIPYPLILVGTQHKINTLSLAHKHHAHNRVGAVVLEGVDMSATFDVTPLSPVDNQFLSSLPIEAQPKLDLFTVYQGWLDRVNALAAARICGTFSLLESSEQLGIRRAALQNHGRLLQSIAKLRGQTAKEKQRDRLAKLRAELDSQEAQLNDLVSNL